MWLYLLLLICCHEALALNSCPGDYIQGGDGYCYGIFSTPLTRINATRECNMDGAWLVSIPDAFTRAFVLGWSNILSEVWLGGTCSCWGQDAYNIEWDDGTDVKPKNTSGKNNGGSYFFMGTSGDYLCQNRYRDTYAYICKMPDPGQSPHYGWSKSPSHFFYKAFDQLKTKDEAEMFCQSQCGNLAVIPSKEVNILLPYFGCLLCGDPQPLVMIGLVKGSNGYFSWTDRTPFNTSSSYSNFHEIDPKTGNCVTVANNGTWAMANCDTPAPFVCSRGPLQKSSPCVQNIISKADNESEPLWTNQILK